MFGKRKGQAAMEFLSTYGWALLIIVIVGAVVFFVVRPAGLVGEAKVGFSGVDVVRFGADSANDDLLLQLHNRRADRINVTNVYVTSSSGGTGEVTELGVELGPGRRTEGFENVTATTLESGDSYSYTVAIEYYFTDVGTGSECSGTRTCFNSTGTLSGTAS